MAARRGGDFSVVTSGCEYDGVVKLVTLLLLLLPGSALVQAESLAKNVKVVYILRMGNGLDQYLASELIKAGFFAVTTDPAKADAIFTDSVGENFEKRYAELYIPPPPKQPDDKDKKGLKGEEIKRGPSTWSRGRGT